MNDGIEVSLDRAGRAIVSSRALWREGLMPEAEAALTDALRVLLAAWAARAPEAENAEPKGTEQTDSAQAGESPKNEPVGPTVPHAAALAALASARYRSLQRLERAVGAIDAAPSAAGPSPRAALSPHFETIAAEAERLHAFTRRKLTPPLSPRARRLRLGIALSAGLLVALVVAYRLWGRPLVRASAVYSWDHSAANVIDGLDATEWLLPDRTEGWIEITLPWKRDIRQVRLLNAHNIYYMDRGAERVRVTAYGPHGQLASVQGRFTKISGKRNPIDLSLKADGVTRLRVEILSYFSSGGGLAEVEWR
jgi:hypothetical protein